MELTFSQLVKHLGSKPCYMMIGQGSKNQFRDARTLRGAIGQVSNRIPVNSNLLYFGDYPTLKKPDIGGKET